MPRSEIVTTRISDDDWKMILELKLKPVHRAYLEEFKRTGNEPMTLAEMWKRVEWRLDIQNGGNKKHDVVFFDQVSNALKVRDVPFRLRSTAYKKYKVVRVK